MTRMETDDKPCSPNGMTRLPFELLELRPKSRLPPVSFPDADFMVTLGEIELGKPSCPLSFVQQGVDVLQEFDEGLDDGIETPVGVADAPRPVGFTRKDDRRRMPCRRRLDPAAVQ